MTARASRKLRMCMAFYRSLYWFREKTERNAANYCMKTINRHYGERTNKP